MILNNFQLKLLSQKKERDLSKNSIARKNENKQNASF